MAFTISMCCLFISHLMIANGQSSERQIQQIPVCAPIHTTTGCNQHAGRKGEPGYPGKKGPRGERGYPGQRWGIGGCPSITYRLPRDNQKTDYVRYRSYVPQMTQATACAWIETSDYNNHATILSYAVSSQNNEFFIVFLNPTTIRVAVGGASSDLSIQSLTSFLKLHLCVWFSKQLRLVGVSINANEVVTSSYSGNSVKGGGSLIIGQEQDAVDAGSLDASQAFSGNVTNLMIWQRVLDVEEIRNLAENCKCPSDYTIAFTLDKTEMYGQASYVIPDSCPHA